MGCDKARLEQDGWPIAVQLCGLLEEAGLDAHLIRRGPPDGRPWRMPDGRPVRVVREAASGTRHPLQGVVTALEHAGDEVVVVPCDLPHLTVEAIAALDRAGVAADHPLVARVPLACLEGLRASVRAGDSARAALAHLPRLAVPTDALLDRNRPDQLGASDLSDRERAERGITQPPREGP